MNGTGCITTVTPEKLVTSDFLAIMDGLHDRGYLNRLVVDEVGSLVPTSFVW
jgi:hypothetical protein